jgi:Spy/CpxP family protein refolding chaperone
MAQTIIDKNTGARFRIRNRAENRERDTLHHGEHLESLTKVLFQILTPEQKAKVREFLKDNPNGCVQRAIAE